MISTTEKNQGRCTITGGPDVHAVVRILHCGETELCRVPEGMSVTCGQHVVVPTRYGRDLARVLGPVCDKNRDSYGETHAIHRIAVDEDMSRAEQNDSRAHHALNVCRDKVDERGLPMRLVTAHYVLDEPRLVFFFTADSRVDFRELVKDLVAEFRIRIELRQIGVRDESRVVGGLGVCGRVLCCHGITDKLKPVSIKMAKVQNLSLNSMKISGPCGRLLCCLEYEYEFYRQEKRGLPNEGTRIKYDDAMFRITEVNILTRTIRLEGDSRILEIPTQRFHQDPVTQRWQIGDRNLAEGPEADAE